MRFAVVGFTLFVACSPPSPTATTPSALPHAPAASVTNVVEAWSELCSGPESVPMEIAGSREFVTVSLPGKAADPLRFHVDTGGNTPGLMLRRSVAERLGFSSAEAMPHTIHIGERDIALPSGANWIVMDDQGDTGKFERSTRKDFSVGQIGAGFLSRFVVCIDPSKGRLGLGDPKHFNLEPGDAKFIPLFMQSGGSNQALYPFVHVLLRDKGAFAGGYGVLLDTGATNSMLDRYKIEYQRKAHPDWATANGAFGDADMVGGAWSEEVLRADDVALDSPTAALAQFGLKERVSIDVGAATFVDRPTGTWSQMFGDVGVTMGSHGAIANDVLLRFRLLIDYPHARLFMEPSARAPDPSASSSRVGLALRFGADGCPEVRQVTDTNAKDTRENVKVGDVLIAVDGHDACKAFHDSLATVLAGTPGTVKKLRVRRGAATLDVDATTAELLIRR